VRLFVGRQDEKKDSVDCLKQKENAVAFSVNEVLFVVLIDWELLLSRNYVPEFECL
jgi:hypothetical protein